MAAIRVRDTSPELKVCSLLHRLGYRFRLHRRDLPGSPDIVLPRHRTLVLVLASASGVQPHHDTENQSGFLGPEVRAERGTGSPPATATQGDGLVRDGRLGV
jgi:hypothetical protein